jgi:hypothetical protein
VAFTPDMLAQIEAQRALFASDDHIRERASVWRDASPEECFAAVIDQCREAEYFLSLKSPGELERVLAPIELPEDTLAILAALQRQPAK